MSITREEAYLNAIAEGGGTDIIPVTREEMFLAHIAGQNVTLPAPITRKEQLLLKVAESIGGSGGSSGGGGLTFTEKGTITHSSGNTYWRRATYFDDLYTPAYDYGIILIDWGGHLGADSTNGIQTQLFVYNPTEYRYVGWGYRSGNSQQLDARNNGVRSATSLREDERETGDGNMYVGYINSNSTSCTAKEAELSKENADALFAIMSGCVGYTAS